MPNIKIKNIKRINSRTKYELQVKDNENYFANGILKHNCRCIIIIDKNGQSTFWSRQGKQFDTLQVVENYIKTLGIHSYVLDCEVCLDNNGDDFQGIMKEIRRKDHTIKNPSCKIFDCLTFEEFSSQKSTTILSERLKRIALPDNPILCFLLQEQYKSKEVLDKWLKIAANNNWEGLILRKDAPYKGKRSNDLLKVKSFIDAEYVVKGITTGPMRYVVDNKEVEEEMLTSVLINHKGYEVGVGSGFSIDERKKFFKDQKQIIGKTICVQYFEETHNQDGGISLRFPTVKFIYEGKRNV